MKFYLGAYMCSAWGATVHSFSLMYRNGTNFMAREIAPKTVAAIGVAANAKDNCLLKNCLFGWAYQVK